MLDTFRHILVGLFFENNGIFGYDISQHLQAADQRDASLARALNTAFLVALSGGKHPARERAVALLKVMSKSPAWSGISDFYLEGIRRILLEIDALESDAGIQVALIDLAEWLGAQDAVRQSEATAERTWSVFFPEAAGIRGRESQRRDALRCRRTVTITEFNPNPITDPSRQLLFTSNVLLTVPQAASKERSDLDPAVRRALEDVDAEGQRIWFDHPVPVGTPPENNEILYGLDALNQAVAFEKRRGNCPGDGRLNVALSISTTHRGLQDLAKSYVNSEIRKRGGYENLSIYLFSESDTRALVEAVLAPAAWRYLGKENAQGVLSVFGTHGEYGRHYSFLKAISAFWSVLIDPRIRGTFKIDLDQTFPQEHLVEETGLSAFEHFKTPLWGASAVDADGRPVELGMIAGALVNQSDIGNSLFTPDVAYPSGPIPPDAYVFFSRMPQALSTDAEMMARYDSEALDGRKRCLQRVHVTGGMTGILVEHLRRHRPFTPSFFGRAEDQAYLMGAFQAEGPRLACVHKPGLIMRHDKDAFAREAIEAARVGQLVGDTVRLLYFSWYGRCLNPNLSAIKRLFDPFTGGFISKTPMTTAYLRFALQAEGFFQARADGDALAFMRSGAERIPRAIMCSQGRFCMLFHRYREERAGWDIFYDTLSALENALARRDPFAIDIQRCACRLIAGCRLST
ncbi:MAG: hypothetical protein ACOWWM_20435 [Desulfobacterales bacterium]